MVLKEPEVSPQVIQIGFIINLFISQKRGNNTFFFYTNVY